MTKKLIFLFISFFILLSFNSFGGLRVGIYENSPMVYTDRLGNPGGIFVDIFEEIAAKEGLKYNYTKLPWNNALESLSRGKIDILLSVAYSKKRNEVFNFTSTTVFVNWARIFNSPDKKIDFLEDLNGTKIAVLANDIYSPGLMSKIDEFKIDAKIIPCKTYGEVFDMVRAKKAHAGLVDRAFGLIHQMEYGLKKSSIIISPVDIKFAFRKGINKNLIKRFDFHLARMEKDYSSIINKPIDKHLGKYPEKEANRFLSYLIITCLVFFAFVSFILVSIYKKRAERKTLEMENQNSQLQLKISEKNKIQEELLVSRQRLKELSENISEIFWIFDLKAQKIDYLSRAYEKIWKRDSAPLYLGTKKWIDYVYIEDRKLFQEEYKKMISNKKATEREYRIVRPDGEIRWVHDRSYLIMDKENNISKIAGTTEDITEKKFFEDQLNQSRKMQAIGTMSGGIAHDFNNILSIIIGNAELAMDSIEKHSPAFDNLKQIESASIRAKEIIKQILIFTRKNRTEKEVIDAGEIIIETMNLLKATIPSNINVITKIDKKRFFILAAPSQINQIIMNLCTNAAFALKDKNRGEIRVSSDLVEVGEGNKIFYDLEKGSYLRIWVKDNGDGIKKDIIQRIFDPYFTTKASGEGSGMGLSVVHGIVKDLKGDILVSSSGRKGSEFQILLPLSMEKPEKNQNKPFKDIKGNERILFIDDEEHLAVLGKNILEGAGFKVTPKTDPVEALKEFSRNSDKYQLIITDMTMPEMTGIELAQELKKIKNEIPIILCTGFSDHDLEKSLNSGIIDSLMYKPVSGNELKAAVRDVIDG